MRALFSCTAGDGHFRPLLPLASAFAAAGHDVVFSTAAANTATVAAAGFANLPAGAGTAVLQPLMREFWAELEQIPFEDRRPATFAKRFATLDAPRKLADLHTQAAAWAPDLIVHETADVAAPPVAASLGVPSVHHSFGLRLPAECLERAVPKTDELWRQLGLEPEPAAGIYRGPYVDICPASMHGSAPGVPTTTLPLQAAAPVAATPAWRARLLQDRPVVYVTLGTVFNDLQLFRIVLEGLAPLDVTVITTIGRNNDPAELGTLPANAIVERYVPQHELLPLTDLAVGHGGSGSTLAAMAHGVPLVLLPRAADQFDNARACAQLGIAKVLRPDEVTSEAVSTAVAALLVDNGARTAAEAVADEIRQMPSPAEVVETLLDPSAAWAPA